MREGGEVWGDSPPLMAPFKGGPKEEGLHSPPLTPSHARATPTCSYFERRFCVTLFFPQRYEKAETLTRYMTGTCSGYIMTEKEQLLIEKYLETSKCYQKNVCKH